MYLDFRRMAISHYFIGLAHFYLRYRLEKKINLLALTNKTLGSLTNPMEYDFSRDMSKNQTLQTNYFLVQTN